MAAYLVTWDLNREKPNYSAARAKFIAQLETLAHVKDPGLDSVRFVASESSADQVSAHLRKALDDNDRLVVTRLRSGEHQGWLAETTWQWINGYV